MEFVCWICEGFVRCQVALGRLLGRLGASCEALRDSWERFKSLLKRLKSVLGASWSGSADDESVAAADDESDFPATAALSFFFSVLNTAMCCGQ